MQPTDHNNIELQNRNPVVHIVSIAAIDMAFAILGLMDSDTQKWTDLLHTENVAGLLLYGIPTWLVCRWLYRRWSNERSIWLRVCMSLAAGVPITFLTIVVIAELAKVLHWV